MAWANPPRGLLRFTTMLRSTPAGSAAAASSASHRAAWPAAGMAADTDLCAWQIAPFGARLASNQVVRSRMKSVRSIQKITKAMKMVAASKLRGVQVKVEGSRGIPIPFVAMLGDNPDNEGNKQVIVIVSSDRGLCGGINSTSVKMSKAFFKMATAASKNAKYVIIGEKGRAQLSRDARQHIAVTVSETQKVGISFSQVSMMADEILKSLKYDTIKLVFNKFRSVVSFEATVATVLSPESMAKESAGGKPAVIDGYQIEDDESKYEILLNLAELGFTAQLYNALLENTASEMGARMSAMDNSSRNAADMLEALTLSYNRSRQAKITTELIEIISGASALEGT